MQDDDERLKLLLELWSEVLEDDDIKPTDNFFDLGGDSIKAMKLVLGARKRGLTITLPQIFNCETVADVAQVARAVAD